MGAQDDTRVQERRKVDAGWFDALCDKQLAFSIQSLLQD